jgi:hypothetical protein
MAVYTFSFDKPYRLEHNIAHRISFRPAHSLIYDKERSCLACELMKTEPLTAAEAATSLHMPAGRVRALIEARQLPARLETPAELASLLAAGQFQAVIPKGCKRSKMRASPSPGCGPPNMPH